MPTRRKTLRPTAPGGLSPRCGVAVTPPVPTRLEPKWLLDNLWPRCYVKCSPVKICVAGYGSTFDRSAFESAQPRGENLQTRSCGGSPTRLDHEFRAIGNQLVVQACIGNRGNTDPACSASKQASERANDEHNHFRHGGMNRTRCPTFRDHTTPSGLGPRWSPTLVPRAAGDRHVAHHVSPRRRHEACCKR